jgi:hypothetical protein
LTYVAAEKDSLATICVYLLFDGLATLQINVCQAELCSLAGKEQGRRSPNA